MRQLLFLFTVIGLTACFDDGKDAKTVKIVDTRQDSDTGSTTTQAVSDSDFKALQAKVKSLESELATVNATINALATQANLKQLWLYDGELVKRHKVVAVYDRGAWQEAMVEIAPGITARYQLGRFADANPLQGPENLVSPSGGLINIGYSLPGCTGDATIGDLNIGADFGQAGTIGNYVAWITSASQRTVGYSYGSYYDGSSCVASSGTTAFEGSRAIVQAKTLYTYPNPLSVGP